MGDLLTQAVLDYQDGLVPLDTVRNQVLEVAFEHLRRCRRKREDDVSEFLLVFHTRVEGLIGRFKDQGLPFRHFLLRSLRWQWNSFRSQSARLRRQSVLVDTGLGIQDADTLAEPAPSWDATLELSKIARKRLVLLALKASPWLEEGHMEAFCDQTGFELPWLEACQYRLLRTTDYRRARRKVVAEKRGDAYYRRLFAEDEAQRESIPDRRRIFEHRAAWYRGRLANLARQEITISTAPTHHNLATLLGMPKGSVDSSLYHLKKAMTSVYSGGQDDPPPGHEQRAQKTRI